MSNQLASSGASGEKKGEPARRTNRVLALYSTARQKDQREIAGAHASPHGICRRWVKGPERRRGGGGITRPQFYVPPTPTSVAPVPSPWEPEGISNPQPMTGSKIKTWGTQGGKGAHPCP